jgi:hypothetical protein
MDTIKLRSFSCECLWTILRRNTDRSVFGGWENPENIDQVGPARSKSDTYFFFGKKYPFGN